MGLDKRWVSILVLAVVGLHVVPVLYKLRHRDQPFWPILAWGMYREARDPGPIRTVLTHTSGVTAGNADVAIDAVLVGLPDDTFHRLYADPMAQGDAAAARALAARLNAQRPGDPFVELRAQLETDAITESGVAKDLQPPIAYRVGP